MSREVRMSNHDDPIDLTKFTFGKARVDVAPLGIATLDLVKLAI